MAKGEDGNFDFNKLRKWDMINKMIEELDSGEYHKYRKELVVKYANGKIVNDLELFKALTFLE